MRSRVFNALSKLLNTIKNDPNKRGINIPISDDSRIIIFSDQHKGAKDFADDFALSEDNYVNALEWYNLHNYSFISLGDSEEFWENTLLQVKKHNKKSFDIERKFHDRASFYKVFGNHDLYWDNDPLAAFHLNDLYGGTVKIHEGILLKYSHPTKSTNIFLTHGHQGDKQSDGNWFSKWFVSNIWAPLQSYLQINPNTPAYDKESKSLHNQLMYEWVSEQENLSLITGHTHQPVFKSLTFLERLYYQLEQARASDDKELQQHFEEKLSEQIKKGETAPTFKAYKPTYFNSGCCCYSDGDITGIEIANGHINLIKWVYTDNGKNSERQLLETSLLTELHQPYKK